MSNIKISELFYSIQGEGRYLGVPSVFLRTFGCNFTCDGFGMPRGGTSIERIQVGLLHEENPYKNYKDLPLVSTGCDSYASWDPAFKDLSPVLTTDAIVNRIMEILPYNEWRDEHLVITGGEPLLGWQKQYPDLLDHPKMASLKEITFETNGTQPLSTAFKRYLAEWSRWYHKEITFSVSAKLSASGEIWADAVKPEIVRSYEKVGTTYLKFVVEKPSDFDEVDRAVSEYRKAKFKGVIYIMPVGGVVKVYDGNKFNVADEAMRRGYYYSPRLHVDLWGNSWGK